MASGSTYRAEIDGLRAIAVLAILLDHAGLPSLPGGFLGVDIFFVISGFVITQVLARELAAGQFSVSAFWRRRMRRILPALITVLLVCLPIAWAIMTPDELKAFLQVFIGAATMVPNMILATQVNYFSPDAESQPLLHLWSLGVEEQFYVLYPFLLLALWRTGAGARWWGLLALTLLGLVLGEVMNRLDPRSAFYFLPPRSWELLVGCVAALTVTRSGIGLRQVLAGLGLFLVTLPMLLPLQSGPGLAMLPAVIGTALCLTQAGSDTWTGRILAWGPVTMIGKISFGAYLWHWPLLAFIRTHLAVEPSLAEKLVLMLAALLLGWLSWRFIETPFRRSNAPAVPRLGTAAGLASVLGLTALGGGAMLAETRGWRHIDWPGLEPAAVHALLQESKPFAWADSCHLINRNYPSRSFLQAWDCPARSVDGLTAWQVALFGDSHAGNFASVLRLAGLNPMQMTGWSCSAVPSLMRPECRLMAETMIAAAKEGGITAVILSNQWREEELSPEALVELEVFWSEYFDRVVVVGPLPSFEKLESRLVRWPREDVAKLDANMTFQEAFIEARNQVAGSEIIHIDATAFFCADRPGCSVLGKGPLMRDESGHLTLESMRDYAQRLVASGILEDIAP
jgi:peptidoglycan/LPS O-acetylase OafA/YrhL